MIAHPTFLRAKLRPISFATGVVVSGIILISPLAQAACTDNAARAQATAGDSCIATGSSYTGISNANNTLLASDAGSTLTIPNNVVANANWASRAGLRTDCRWLARR